MKTIECNSCHKKVEVEEDWVFKSCPMCRVKDKARKEIVKYKRRLDRQARNRIKELKLEKAMSFTEWSKFAREVLHNTEPSWEQYLDYLRLRKEHEIYDEAERESYRLKAGNRQKYALIRFDLFEPSNRRNCYSFRMNRLNGSEDVSHLDECESCGDWNFNFVNEMLKPRECEDSGSWIQTPRDDSEFGFEKSKTIPDHSLDRFKPKQQSEAETINDAFQKGNVRVESQPNPEAQPTEPQSDQDFISQLEDNYLKRKPQSEQPREQSETDNEDQEAEGE